jgi:hypothetical protein
MADNSEETSQTETETVDESQERQISDILDGQSSPSQDTEGIDRDGDSVVNELARNAEQQAEAQGAHASGEEVKERAESPGERELSGDDAETVEEAQEEEGEEDRAEEDSEPDRQEEEEVDLKISDEGDGEEAQERDEEEPPSWAQDLIEENKRLRQEVDSLKNEEPEQEESRELDTNLDSEDYQDIEFLGEEEIQEMREDPQKFNEVMSRLYHAMREDLVRVVPEIAERAMNRKSTVQQAVDKFWAENEDLQDKAQVVQAAAQQVQSANPNASMQAILNKAGEVARQWLDADRTAQKREQERRGSENDSDSSTDQPNTPSGSRRPSPSDNRSEEQKGIDNMIEATQR